MADEPSPKLTQAQETALLSLLSGSTIKAAAQAANVSRETLHKWLREHTDFIAELNRLRNDLRASVMQRMEYLADKAVAVVAAQIDAGDPAAALAILKGLGFLSGKAAEVRPEEAKLVAAKLAQERLARECGLWS